MWLNTLREGLEWSSQGIQALAVIILIVSILFASLRSLVQLLRRFPHAYRAYKVLLGRSLVLSLELMVAADVIRTVSLDLTAKGLELLAGLVAIRTFLSWSVVVELEGHWPWQSTAMPVQEGELGGNDARTSLFSHMGRPNKPDNRSAEVPVRSAALHVSSSSNP